MTSTQFVNQINTELAKAKALAAKTAAQLESNAEMSQVNDQRKADRRSYHAPRRASRLGPEPRSPATRSRAAAAVAEGFGARRAGRRVREDDRGSAGVG